MTEDLIVKARAAELIQTDLKRKRWRRTCCTYVAISFGVGIVVGMMIPYHIHAVPDGHIIHQAHPQPSAKQ